MKRIDKALEDVNVLECGNVNMHPEFLGGGGLLKGLKAWIIARM